MVKFYEANAHFYDSLASLTNALMDYLMAANGWNVHVRFPGITEITKSRHEKLTWKWAQENSHQWFTCWVVTTSSPAWIVTPLLQIWPTLFLSLDFQFPAQCLTQELLSERRSGRYWALPIGTGRAQLPANTIIRRYVRHSEEIRKKLQKAFVQNTAMLKNITTAR